MKYIPLVQVCDFQGGSQPPKDQWICYEKEGYIRMLQIRDFTQPNKDNVEFVCISKTIKTCNEDDILIGRYGASVGKILTGLAGAYNVAIIKTIPDTSKLSKRFLYHYLNSPYFQSFILSVGSRAAQAGFNKDDLSDAHIPDLSLEEQSNVVSQLDKVTEMITLRKEELAKLDELVKSRFIELFGDVSDFVNITDIAHTYIGLVTTMTKHYCSSGTPLLFNSSIKSDKIVWDGTYLDAEFAEANKSRMHKTNDIVTVHTGDIGTSAVVGEELNNSLGFATIVTRINDTSRYYPRFVSSFLNYGSGKEQLKKYSRDVRNNLNLKDFNRLMVPNVSALEQKRYVDFVEQTDKSKLAVQQSLEKLETLKKALMQKYFG